jgi:nucleotide-binding universal stress UspA family protein
MGMMFAFVDMKLRGSINVKEPVMLPLKVILHPTDFSPHSQQAFQLASLLARDTGARLIVLHVIELPLIAYSGVPMAPPLPLMPGEERQALAKQLRQIRPQDPAITVEHRLEQGDPATAILEIAKETGSDLIALGTHGRTGLGRLLMGSVAEKVVRGATCPVLTVKTP